MRHAKSSWDNETLTDHARPLNMRGRESADMIAKTLTAKNVAPDIIWSSDAQRTKETAARMIAIIPGAQTIFYQPGFYMANTHQVLNLCAASEEPDGKLLLLGHNPGWADLFEHFSGHTHRYPTGACAIFARANESENWLTPTAWQFKDILLPRALLA